MLTTALLPLLLIPVPPATTTTEEASPVPGSSDTEGIEVYQSADGAHSLRIDARVVIDAAIYGDSEVLIDGDPQLGLNGGTELRSARLALKGTFDHVWSYELDFDVADAELNIEDMWLGYSTSEATKWRVGQFKEPFGLERLSSSRYRTFMERALPDALTPGRHIGIGGSTGGDNWSLAGGFFGQEADDVDDAKDFETADNEGYGLTCRATFAPIHDDDFTVHLGAAVRHGVPDAETDDSDTASDIVRYRTRSETHVSRVRFLDTDKITGVDWVDTIGLEAAAAWGPLRLQTEYMTTSLDRDDGLRDASFDGYYGTLAWMITGEQRAYRGNEGEFGRIEPRSKRGAWEAAFRFSHIDLNDHDAGVTGGSANQCTIGLNWYASRHVRVMAGYSWVDHDEYADATGDTAGDEDISIAQIRFLVTL